MYIDIQQIPRYEMLEVIICVWQEALDSHVVSNDIGIKESYYKEQDMKYFRLKSVCGRKRWTHTLCQMIYWYQRNLLQTARYEILEVIICVWQEAMDSHAVSNDGPAPPRCHQSH